MLFRDHLLAHGGGTNGVARLRPEILNCLSLSGPGGPGNLGGGRRPPHPLPPFPELPGPPRLNKNMISGINLASPLVPSPRAGE